MWISIVIRSLPVQMSEVREFLSPTYHDFGEYSPLVIRRTAVGRRYASTWQRRDSQRIAEKASGRRIEERNA